jgi:uncharacterized secreted protein with C-terminal beta-propeller domain
MRNKIKLALLALAISGCSTQPPEVTETKLAGYNRYLVVIDGCQYIVVGNGQSQMMSHRGNCSNPIHPENKKK